MRSIRHIFFTPLLLVIAFHEQARGVYQLPNVIKVFDRAVRARNVSIRSGPTPTTSVLKEWELAQSDQKIFPMILSTRGGKLNLQFAPQELVQPEALERVLRDFYNTKLGALVRRRSPSVSMAVRQENITLGGIQGKIVYRILADPETGSPRIVAFFSQKKILHSEAGPLLDKLVRLKLTQVGPAKASNSLLAEPAQNQLQNTAKAAPPETLDPQLAQRAEDLFLARGAISRNNPNRFSINSLEPTLKTHSLKELAERSLQQAIKHQKDDVALFDFLKGMGISPGTAERILDEPVRKSNLQFLIGRYREDRAGAELWSSMLVTELQKAHMAGTMYGARAAALVARHHTQSPLRAQSSTARIQVDLDQLSFQLEKHKVHGLHRIGFESSVQAGKSVTEALPLACVQCAPSLSEIRSISFNKFFLEHTRAHQLGSSEFAEFRLLEHRLASAGDSESKKNILREIQRKGLGRSDRPSSLSVLDEDFYLAPQRLRDGRNFKLVSNPGDATPTFEFTSTVRLANSDKSDHRLFDQVYRISICSAPQCQSGGNTFRRGEVVTFFAKCGEFVVQIPPITNLNRRYLKGWDEQKSRDYYLKRVRC